jgi:hypothetical protein
LAAASNFSTYAKPSAPAGAPTLEITRSYVDDRECAVMIAVGLYPADRFVHSTRFRVPRP